MRPASEIAEQVTQYMVGHGPHRAAAVIQRDREELVREIYEWVRFKGHPYAAEEIERKYLKGSSDER